jgi:hypothetical protein
VRKEGKKGVRQKRQEPRSVKVAWVDFNGMVGIENHVGLETVHPREREGGREGGRGRKVGTTSFPPWRRCR